MISSIIAVHVKLDSSYVRMELRHVPDMVSRLYMGVCPEGP